MVPLAPISAQKSGGTSRSRRPPWHGSNPRQAAADVLRGLADPIALYGGGRRLLWRESEGRATEDKVRQAAFAFLMASQVRQMDSPCL